MWSGTSLIAIGTVSGLLVVGCAVHPDQGGRRALGDHHSAVVAQVADRDAAPWAPHQHRSVDDAAASALGATLPDWQPVAGQPLARIPVLRSHDGVLNVDLATVLETIQISGSPATTTPYNGMFTGPTLKVNPGDTVNVDLANESGLVTNIHYHGMHVSPKGISDNVFRMMKSGRTYRSTIHIPADHETGLFWYHAHMHGNTDSQVFGGMRGLLVVGNIVKEHLPRRFAGITEHLFSVNDIFVKNGMVTNAAAMPKDSTLLMNSQLRPTWHMRPGETQLLRFANTGSDRFYNLKLPGHSFAVIAEDGSPVWRVYRRKELVLPPGKRFEVLVTAVRPGTYPLRTTRYRQGEGRFNLDPAATLATVTVAGKRARPLALPHRLRGARTENLATAHVARRRTFRFRLMVKGKNFARINGQYFRMNQNPVTTRLGSVEEWTLKNAHAKTTAENSQHPFHIHVNDVQVMSVNGRPYHARGLQDVVVIPVNGEVVIRQRFEDFTGKFVFHCHILDHEDGGMMRAVRVVRPRSHHALG